jgi:hypothetical protein
VQIVKKAFSDERPEIPDFVPEFVRTLIRFCWSLNRDDRLKFSDIFKALERNKFMIANKVEPVVCHPRRISPIKQNSKSV